MEMLAKQAFMKVDERTLKAFRESGKTPTLKSSQPRGEQLLKGNNMMHSMRQTGISALSPHSQRSNGDSSSVGKLGYLGTFQDKEQDRFWSEVIDEDMRKHKMEVE